MHAGGHGFKSRPVHSFSGLRAQHASAKAPCRRPPSPRTRPARRRQAGLRRGVIPLRPGALRACAVRGGSPGCACPPSPPPPSSSGGCPAGAAPADRFAPGCPGARTPAASRRSADVIQTKKIKKSAVCTLGDCPAVQLALKGHLVHLGHVWVLTGCLGSQLYESGVNPDYVR